MQKLIQKTKQANVTKDMLTMNDTDNLLELIRN